MIIISMTSYGERLKLCSKTIFSLLNGTYKNIKIVLTIFKDDEKNIPEELQLLINNNLVELLIADENLKSHLKYFYTMQKYKNNFIITVDDDFIYPKNLIKKLIEYKDNNKIIAHRGHKITSSQYNYLNPTNSSTSIKNLGLGAFGILYPPNCLKLTNDNIPEIKTILHNDDVYLKVLGLRNSIPTLILNTPINLYKELNTGENNLRTKNWAGRTQKEMDNFKKELEQLKNE